MRNASQPTYLHAAKAILIHPSAWKAIFYELRPNSVLRRSGASFVLLRTYCAIAQNPHSERGRMRRLAILGGDE